MSHDPSPELTDLLADAAHDDGRPLPFTAADLTRRGQRARRRRTAGAAGAGVLALAVVVGGVVMAQHRPDRVDTQVADGGPTTGRSDTTGPTTTPTSSTTYPDAARVTQRCDAAGDRGAPQLEADGWQLDAEASDPRGTTATFVSADGSQWATCTLDDAYGDQLDAAAPLPTTAVPSSWRTDAIGRDGSVAFAPGCADAKDKPCSTNDYSVDGPLRPGVAQVGLVSPSGDQTVVQGQHTYVARFVEASPADGSSTPRMLVTLLGPAGRRIITYDLNEAMR